jgi:hypothetical protein
MFIHKRYKTEEYNVILPEYFIVHDQVIKFLTLHDFHQVSHINWFLPIYELGGYHQNNSRSKRYLKVIFTALKRDNNYFPLLPHDGSACTNLPHLWELFPSLSTFFQAC